MERPNRFDDELCRPFVDALPIDGVAVSTIGGLSDAETLSVTDVLADLIDEAQLDLGEGPCWDSVATRAWTEAAPFGDPSDRRWPGFRDAVAGVAIGGLFSLPLSVGGLLVGTVDLWAESNDGISDRDRAAALEIGAATAREVLRASLQQLETVLAEVDDEGPRAVIHQATGMVIAQLDIDADHALVLLRARAFSAGRPVREIARDIVERRLDFSRERE